VLVHSFEIRPAHAVVTALWHSAGAHSNAQSRGPPPRGSPSFARQHTGRCSLTRRQRASGRVRFAIRVETARLSVQETSKTLCRIHSFYVRVMRADSSLVRHLHAGL
jgi:hypothetical protein